MPDNPFKVTNLSVSDKNTAVVIIHGFTGEELSTWEGFIPLLTTDPELAHHDFYFWGYPSDIKLKYILLKYIWEDDPNLLTLGKGLKTMLDTYTQAYEKLVLVGHSMGGLIIQSFILDELFAGRRQNLARLTEVVLYGTPSGGLEKANYGKVLKNQVADMAVSGEFIKGLRQDWQEQIDDNRSAFKRAVNFRLTLVAGMKDKFVPQESSLDPFPFDEKEIAPGNHTEMVKPAMVGEPPFRILKTRLMRPALTQTQRRLITGESEAVVKTLNQVRAAAELGELDYLVGLAKDVLSKAVSEMPLVERALGLALLDREQYQLSAALLKRYRYFAMPDNSNPSNPFLSDAQAVQQLAIALSGLDDNAGAVALLRELDPQVQKDPETQGILGGRFKRQWRKGRASSVGWRAFDLYNEAFETAKRQRDADQSFYNGINAAYMDLALGGDSHQAIAQQVVEIINGLPQRDYWAEATRAEAFLLLGQYDEALTNYRRAHRKQSASRHWRTTKEQALDIIAIQGNPPQAQAVTEALRNLN